MKIINLIKVFDIGLLIPVIIAILIFACLAMGAPYIASQLKQAEGQGSAGIYIHETE